MLDQPINEYRVDVNDICYPFSFAVLVPGATKEQADEVMFNIILRWRGHVQEGHEDMNVTPLYVNGSLYESADEPYTQKEFPNVFVYHFSFDECRKSCFDIEVKADNRFFADIKIMLLMTNWRDIVDFEFCQKTVLTPVMWGVNGNPYGSKSFLSVDVVGGPAAFSIGDRDSLIKPAEYYFMTAPLVIASAAIKLEQRTDFSLYADVVSASAVKQSGEVDIDAVVGNKWLVSEDVDVIPCIYNFSEMGASSANAVSRGLEVSNVQNVSDIIPVIGKPSPTSVDASSYLEIPVKRIEASGTGIDSAGTMFILDDSFDLDQAISMWVAPDNVEEMLSVNTLLDLKSNGKDAGAIVRVKYEPVTNENRND